MAMSVFYGLVAICLFGIALADPLPGACPDMETMPGFELNRFLGRWYEVKRYYQISETEAKCVSALYAPRDNSSVKFLHSQISSSTGKPFSMEGSLSQPNPNEPGKLEMSFHGIPLKGNFWILGTDYKTYAIVYSCKNKATSHVQFAWILTREQHPSNSVVEGALKVAEDHNVDLKPFLNTDQTHCMC